jgi:nucleotide-binding universal stress UspA family protein
MIKSILVATDGSNHAAHALDFAVDIAVRYDAKFTIVHVLTHDHPSPELQRMIKVEHLNDPAPIHKNPATGSYTAVGRFLRGEIEDAELRAIAVIGEDIMDKAVKRAKKAGIEGIQAEIREGDYANCILESANAAEADLIVMGRRGLSNIQGFVTGSVSHKVSQRADCAVLTVK